VVVFVNLLNLVSIFYLFYEKGRIFCDTFAYVDSVCCFCLELNFNLDLIKIFESIYFFESDVLIDFEVLLF
jgi:hypothetical protein